MTEARSVSYSVNEGGLITQIMVILFPFWAL